MFDPVQSDTYTEHYIHVSSVIYLDIWRSAYGDAAYPYGDTASPAGDAAYPYGNTASPAGDAAYPYGDTASPAGDVISPNFGIRDTTHAEMCFFFQNTYQFRIEDPCIQLGRHS